MLVLILVLVHILMGQYANDSNRVIVDSTCVCGSAALAPTTLQYRSEGRGGGVMIYVKDHVNCQRICWPFEHDLECIGLKIVLSSEMSFVLIIF